MQNYNTLLQLAQLLVPKDTSLVKEVALSAEKPNNYENTFTEVLKRRGLVPIAKLPWIAIVNGLKSRKQLIELDWKEYPDRFITAIGELLPETEDGKTARDAIYSLEFEDDEEPHIILYNIDKVLHSHGYTVIVIDIDSDSYPLCVIPLKYYTEAEKLAKSGGYGELFNFYEIGQE